MKQTLKLINLKQYADAEFNSEGQMIAFIGNHGTGKSTAIQSLETVLTCKGFMKDPIKHGEKEAKIEWRGNDNEGNPIVIIVEIGEDNTHTFTAGVIVNNKQKTIHDVKKIKELIGNYYQLTAEDVLSMVKYTEGRREFINKYLLPLLSDTQRERLAELQISISDKKNKQTEGNLYHTRAELNKELEKLNIELKTQGITPEEQKELDSKQVIFDALIKLEKEYSEHKDDNIEWYRLKSDIDDIEDNQNKIGELFDWFFTKNELDFKEQSEFIATKIGLKLALMNEKLAKLYSKDKLEILSGNIERGKAKKTTLEGYEKRLTPDKDKIAERDRKFKRLNEIGQEIENNKEEIKLIYANSKFPSGLTIDDEGTIMLNGFLLDDTVTSETETKIAIIELLCNISTSQYINLGNWSLYSEDARKKIKALSDKYNRCMVGQLVSEDNKVTLTNIVVG